MDKTFIATPAKDLIPQKSTRRRKHVLTMTLTPRLVLMLGDDGMLYSFVDFGRAADANLLFLNDASTRVPPALVNDTIQ